MAKELLDGKWVMVNLNLAKIVAWCRTDIEAAASTGLCPIKLYTLVFVFRRYMPGDTQAIEGVNSIARLLSERCRAIGLPLLDARTRAKKELGGVGQQSRWSERRPLALRMLHDTMLHYDDGKRLQQNHQRFESATPLPLTKSFFRVDDSSLQKTNPDESVESMKDNWTRLQVLKLHRTMKKAFVCKVLSFDKDLRTGWIVIDKLYAVCFVVEMEIDPDTDPDSLDDTVYLLARNCLHIKVRCEPKRSKCTAYILLKACCSSLLFVGCCVVAFVCLLVCSFDC